MNRVVRYALVTVGLLCPCITATTLEIAIPVLNKSAGEVESGSATGFVNYNKPLNTTGLTEIEFQDVTSASITVTLFPFLNESGPGEGTIQYSVLLEPFDQVSFLGIEESKESECLIGLRIE